MKWWVPWLLAFCVFAPAGFAQLPEGDVHGYVYVEPFELRKEFAIRLRAFPNWAAGVPPDGVLDKAHQAKILFEVAKALDESCPLQVDGTPLKPGLDSVRFVRVEAEAGVLPDERTEIPVQEAQVAARFGSSMKGYPDEVSIHWNLFPADPSVKVLLSFVSAGGRASVYPTREAPNQKWLVAKKKDAGELLPVPQIHPASAGSSPVQIPFFTMVFGILAVVCGLAGRVTQGNPKLLAGTAAALFLIIALATWAVAGLPLRSANPDYQLVPEKDAEALVHALLRNIYTSFDYREESEIYDTLARSVQGSLLEKIYLDVRRGLELEGQGGPRVKINHIDLRSCHLEPAENGGLRADAEWVAVGDITHWGHIHTRLNKYRAWLTLQPVDSTWKVTDIEIVEEGRI